MCIQKGNMVAEDAITGKVYTHREHGYNIKYIDAEDAVTYTHAVSD